VKLKLSHRSAARLLKFAPLAGLFLPFALHAQTAEKLRLKTPAAKTSATSKTPLSSTRAVMGQIRFESMQYFTPVEDVPELTRSQYLSARLSVIAPDEGILGLGYTADLSAGTFFRRSQSDYVVHELNTFTHFSENTAAVLGRKKSHWSELDRRWKLGLWQPNFAMDALRPEEQGLTGLFLNYSTENFQILGFASPIFIPTMGPEIREEGGSLVSDSRWYRKPSSEYNFSNNVQSIVYDLDIPEATKLVFNPSSAMMLRFGNQLQGPWMTTSWGYKPVNDLALKRQNFKAADAPKVSATVSPILAFHNIVSTDIGYSLSDVQVSASYLEDRPKDLSVEDQWVVQRLEPVKASSVQLDWMIRNVFSGDVQVQMGYLKVGGARIRDVMADGEPDDFTVIDRRLKFTDAASFGFEGEFFRIAKKSFVTKFRYLYDWEQQGSLVNTEFQFSPDRQWAVLIGADILGVQDETSTSSGFLNQYRANDRFYGGMTYVF
jgi:hypothetical protein